MILSGGEREFLRSVAARLAPGSAELDAAGRERFFALVEKTLGEKPEGVRALFSTFLRALRWLPALRYGAPLDRLSGERQDAALRWFQDAPLLPLRQGFWGLKALVFLGYYGQTELRELFAYRPETDGNKHLHAR